ncbi:hypothetical protein Q3G72_027435 [Acer saccharum]|nr:hypothetical protein Q3G72_027435 [Acer saccharum]
MGIRALVKGGDSNGGKLASPPAFFVSVIVRWRWLLCCASNSRARSIAAVRDVLKLGHWTVQLRQFWCYEMVRLMPKGILPFVTIRGLTLSFSTFAVFGIYQSSIDGCQHIFHLLHHLFLAFP